MTPSTTTKHHPIGALIDGQYRLIESLGVGGMGSIYLAKQTAFDREVVLKFIRSEIASDEDIQRFQREARLIARLNSPHIVTVHAFGNTQSGEPFLVMERIKGRVLSALVRRKKPVRLRRALTIADQILTALAEAHLHDVVHRDLKPSNIMLTVTSNGDEIVKVLDFGIAKLSQSNESEPTVTKTGTIVGTPRYMSPEQIRSRPIDGRSDLYSLGVILFELIFSRHPLSADTETAYLAAHLVDQPEVPERTADGHATPDDVAELLYCTLAKDPDERYVSSLTMQQAIRAALRDLAPPRSRLPRPPSGASPSLDSLVAATAPAALGETAEHAVPEETAEHTAALEETAPRPIVRLPQRPSLETGLADDKAFGATVPERPAFAPPPADLGATIPDQPTFSARRDNLSTTIPDRPVASPRARRAIPETQESHIVPDITPVSSAGSASPHHTRLWIGVGACILIIAIAIIAMLGG